MALEEATAIKTRSHKNPHTDTTMAPEEKVKPFPFLSLSGELRNQIYTYILGPRLPRPIPSEAPGDNTHEEHFWPDRKFNTALFLLNRQTNREFSDVLWNTLALEWNVDSFELQPDHLARLRCMQPRLQRCKVLLDLRSPYWKVFRPRRPLYNPTNRDITASALEIEKTIFGLGHLLNSSMPHLKEIHIEYLEDKHTINDDYWLLYRNGAMVHWMGADLKVVVGEDLRGFKDVRIGGNLCEECTALVLSVIEQPKEARPDEWNEGPGVCFPKDTLPRWDQKIRDWV
ncbi:MAG: hypothetical protein Q9220_004996 [cf. Caloplaca sp. 1 TL-2023]